MMDTGYRGIGHTITAISTMIVDDSAIDWRECCVKVKSLEDASYTSCLQIEKNPHAALHVRGEADVF